MVVGGGGGGGGGIHDHSGTDMQYEEYEGVGIAWLAYRCLLQQKILTNYAHDDTT